MQTIEINGKPCTLITVELFERLIQDKQVKARENQRKDIATTDECLEILGCSLSTFRKKVREQGSCIRKAKINGRYIRSSIIKYRDSKK